MWYHIFPKGFLLRANIKDNQNPLALFQILIGKSKKKKKTFGYNMLQLVMIISVYGQLVTDLFTLDRINSYPVYLVARLGFFF